MVHNVTRHNRTKDPLGDGLCESHHRQTRTDAAGRTFCSTVETAIALAEKRRLPVWLAPDTGMWWMLAVQAM